MAFSVASLRAVRDALVNGKIAGNVQLAVAMEDVNSDVMKNETLILVDASSFPNFKCARKIKPKRRFNVQASILRTKSKHEWTVEDVADFAMQEKEWAEIAKPIPFEEIPTEEASEDIICILVGPTCSFDMLVKALEDLADTRGVPYTGLKTYVNLLPGAGINIGTVWSQDVPKWFAEPTPIFSEVALVVDRFASPATSITMANMWAIYYATKDDRPIHVIVPADVRTLMRQQLPEQAQNVFAWINSIRIEHCKLPSFCSADSEESKCEMNLSVEQDILARARQTGLGPVTKATKDALLEWALQNTRVVLDRLSIRLVQEKNGNYKPEARAYAMRALILAETAALTLLSAARPEESLRYLSEALRFQTIADPHPSALATSQLLCHRARCSMELKQYQNGLVDVERVDGMLSDLTEPHGPSIGLCHIDALQILADLKRRCGAREEAVEALSRLLALKTKIYGEEHVEVLATMEVLVELQLELRHGSFAILTAVKALQLSKHLNGEKHPHTARCYNLMGRAMAMQTRKNEALQMLSKAIEIHLSIFGENDPRLAEFRHDLAKVK